MSTLEWIVSIIVVGIVLAAFTPQGREGLKTFVNWFGSLFGLGAKNLETPATDRQRLGVQVDMETRAGLENAEKSYARAKTILTEKEALLKERKQHDGNLEEALRQAEKLMSDKTPDTEQATVLGKVKAIGQAAKAKLDGIDATLEANAENYLWAQKIMDESEILFSQLPDLAAQKLREGDVNAAAQELAAAQKLAAQGQSSFSNSAAQRTLESMKRKTAETKAQAEAAQKRAMAAPASAAVAASMLRQTGKSMTADFDELLAQRAGK